MFCNREKNNQMERIRALKLNLNPGTNKDNKKVRKKFNISFEKKQNITSLNIVNIGNGIPKKIITNYNNFENNNYHYNNTSNILFTNYTYKRLNLGNYYSYKKNNNESGLYQRKNMTKTPIIRRCKTSNNMDFNKIINNYPLKKDYKKKFSLQDKIILNRANLFNLRKDLTIKPVNIINNTNIPRKDSNSVKFSVTNDGSTVSIHGNTIHGLPIIQGVCSKCINNELIKLKKINNKIYKTRNIYNDIFPKMYYTEKDRLIEQNSSAEFNLNKPVNERIKQRVITNYLKKEEYFKNKNPISQYNMKLEADNYILNNNSKISKFSIPSIGLEKFRNKYLPSKEQYINNLNEQIIEKKRTYEKERKKEKDLFNYYTNKNITRGNLEEENKIMNEKIKQKELLNENIKLAQMKKNKELMEKSNDIELEKKYIQIIENKDKENNTIQNNIKLRIRRDLKEKLDEQINTKIKRNNSFDFKCRIKRINSRNIPDISDNNIFTENKINQYGRCLHCRKLFKKNQICPKGEYENIKKAEIVNENELNKIINKKI